MAWLVQLGKRRAGWYLPRGMERFLPRSRRGAWSIRPEFQNLTVGDLIPDYGGPDETFEVKVVQAPHVLVYRSQLGTMNLSWTVSLTEDAVEDDVATRVHLRLRLGPVRHP